MPFLEKINPDRFQPDLNNETDQGIYVQLQKLNQIAERFNTLQTAKKITLKANEDVIKVIETLKFILVNKKYISYAMEHPDENPSDEEKQKGIIRTQSGTSIHIKNTTTQPPAEFIGAKFFTFKEDRNLLIGAYEQIKDDDNQLACLANQFIWEDTIGCYEARIARARQYCEGILTDKPLSLDDLMNRFAQKYSVVERKFECLDSEHFYQAAYDFFADFAFTPVTHVVREDGNCRNETELLSKDIIDQALEDYFFDFFDFFEDVPKREKAYPHSSLNVLLQIREYQLLAKVDSSDLLDHLSLIRQIEDPETNRPYRTINYHRYTPQERLNPLTREIEWTSHKERGLRKPNSQYTKKTAVSLLTDVMRVYTDGIGFLFDKNKCKIDNRYVFASNARTFDLWWRNRQERLTGQRAIPLETLTEQLIEKRKQAIVPLHNEILAKVNKQSIVGFFATEGNEDDQDFDRIRRFRLLYWLAFNTIEDSLRFFPPLIIQSQYVAARPYHEDHQWEDIKQCLSFYCHPNTLIINFFLYANILTSLLRRSIYSLEIIKQHLRQVFEQLNESACLILIGFVLLEDKQHSQLLFDVFHETNQQPTPQHNKLLVELTNDAGEFPLKKLLETFDNYCKKTKYEKNYGELFRRLKHTYSLEALFQNLPNDLDTDEQFKDYLTIDILCRNYKKPADINKLLRLGSPEQVIYLLCRYSKKNKKLPPVDTDPIIKKTEQIIIDIVQRHPELSISNCYGADRWISLHGSERLNAHVFPLKTLASRNAGSDYTLRIIWLLFLATVMSAPFTLGLSFSAGLYFLPVIVFGALAITALALNLLRPIVMLSWGLHINRHFGLNKEISFLPRLQSWKESLLPLKKLLPNRQTFSPYTDNKRLSRDMLLPFRGTKHISQGLIGIVSSFKLNQAPKLTAIHLVYSALQVVRGIVEIAASPLVYLIKTPICLGLKIIEACKENPLISRLKMLVNNVPSLNQSDSVHNSDEVVPLATDCSDIQDTPSSQSKLFVSLHKVHRQYKQHANFYSIQLNLKKKRENKEWKALKARFFKSDAEDDLSTAVEKYKAIMRINN